MPYVIMDNFCPCFIRNICFVGFLQSGDFVALYLVDGFVEFAINQGNGVKIVRLAFTYGGFLLKTFELKQQCDLISL